MKEIQITRYESLDGTLYDNPEKCKRADIIWREENEYDVDEEIKSYELEYKQTQRNREGMGPRRKISVYPMIVIRRGKHGDDFYIGNNEQGLLEIFWEIFKDECHPDYGSYRYLPKSDEISQKILSTENREAAYGFVMERSEYEYERIEIERPKVYE